MFNKKKCKNCDSKIDSNYNFCPYCGFSFKKSKKDLGMLGENDFTGFENMQMPMGLGGLFNSLVKDLSKQFNELEKNSQDFDSNKIKKNGVSINISTSGNTSPRINIQRFGEGAPKKKIIQEVKGKQFKLSEEKIKELMKNSRVEPKTEVKRLSNSVVYEMKMPDVGSVDNVAITKLENSIEIKALGLKKVYSKILPVNFPIRNYWLEKSVFFLELAN